ncbi:excinuclease ABC subunit UvrA [bacterium]|nr:excinuclease ABC subunit UvrA [bacterium]
MQHLLLHGVRQNNLKNVSLDLPLGTVVIVTGPSGSGKSSLAFETVYAEGQRRYMQSLSTYARQFLEKFRAPIVDKIQNIPPTIAIEQINPVRNSRATVGTTTEIYDHLRLLFEKVGQEYCAECDVPMERFSYDQLCERIFDSHAGQTLVFTFSRKLVGKKDTIADILGEYLRSGYSRAIQDGKLVSLEDQAALKGKSVDIIIDRVKIPDSKLSAESRTRLAEALRTSMELGSGVATAFAEKAERTFEPAGDFTTQTRCPQCRKITPPKTAISFSFNSPLGACQTCKGFGNTLEVDPDLVIPNASLSIAQGAVDPFTKPSLKQWQKKLLEFCKKARIDADLPYQQLPADQRKKVFDGDKSFKGIRGVFEMLDREKYKMRIRVFVSRYTSPFLCRDCQGSRLNASGLRVKVGGRNIAEITELSIEEIHRFFSKLTLTAREKKIAVDVLSQLDRRLSTLVTVGLGYLTLARLTRSLSGGEYQRILLSTQLSQGLTDTLYVLDEPSIGLHPKDTQQLLKVLKHLLDLGNSLLIVEHDPEVIEWGHHIVDMGPGSGSRGGEVMFAGDRQAFLASGSQTAKAVSEWRKDCLEAMQTAPRHTPSQWLEVRGAEGNNLKKVDVRIPLKSLVSITGVSGSGKSTLIVDTLYQAMVKIFQGRSEKIAKFASISGFEFLSSVELVDQSAIGKSSRSNPITFIKGYDEVRSLFAKTREAIARKLGAGHFSFNVAGGRCDTCEGEGRVKVDMVFLEDIFVPCQACDEKRFKPSVLAVKYRGKNIDDILKMTVDVAYDFFNDNSVLRSKLALLQEVGLGYLQLGQPGFTLSGGEAQRLKIARELAGATVKRLPTLFILDEPTTGLHFSEIRRLISVLRRLVANGHSVLVIEHNVQMICASQYIIDLGPDGGEGGGTVVAAGTPKELAEQGRPHTGRYLAEILGTTPLR